MDLICADGCGYSCAETRLALLSARRCWRRCRILLTLRVRQRSDNEWTDAVKDFAVDGVGEE